jgi:peptidoglycan hydrolase-like protein with peptidoglycan-binding domain
LAAALKSSVRLGACTVAALLCTPLAGPVSALASNSGGAAAAGPAPASPAATPVKTTPSAHVTSVRITSVSCTPSARCSTNPHQVTVRGTLLLTGKGLRAGMMVAFPRSPGARISSNSPTTRLRATSAGLLVTVPSTAHSGNIMVLLGGGRHTSSYGPIYVFNRPLRRAKPRPLVPTGGSGPQSGTAFDGQGMWIWYVSQSSGGVPAAIISRAHSSGVTTVFVKSSDGATNYWSQFSPALVSELHAGGLKVCAWQYVYGANPVGEANLGARAVANGADCLVIDAEAEYEGHYAAAQRYITALRAKIGPNYPLGLASFPYVSYHSSLPYSVFLAPGAAQYNAPQMYWKAIGQSVDTVYANTYIGNRIYGRPIFPLGQTYEGVSSSDLARFRQEAILYNASGISFWDWQETRSNGWSALAAPLGPLEGVTPNSEYPELHKGSKGDQVLWLQEHLATALPEQETTGTFGAQTEADLRAFQGSKGIAVSGRASAATWQALLALAPVAVDWTGGGPAG